jgi:hypothetical protein
MRRVLIGIRHTRGTGIDTLPVLMRSRNIMGTATVDGGRNPPASLKHIMQLNDRRSCG